MRPFHPGFHDCGGVHRVRRRHLYPSDHDDDEDPDRERIDSDLIEQTRSDKRLDDGGTPVATANREVVQSFDGRITPTGVAAAEMKFRHDTSVPGTPQTNGIVGGLVRRVKEGTSALFMQSGLCHKYWEAAMECFCVSSNSLVTAQTAPFGVRHLTKQHLGVTSLPHTRTSCRSRLGPALIICQRTRKSRKS